MKLSKKFSCLTPTSENIVEQHKHWLSSGVMKEEKPYNKHRETWYIVS